MTNVSAMKINENTISIQQQNQGGTVEEALLIKEKDSSVLYSGLFDNILLYDLVISLAPYLSKVVVKEGILGASFHRFLEEEIPVWIYPEVQIPNSYTHEECSKLIRI